MSSLTSLPRSPQKIRKSSATWRQFCWCYTWKTKITMATETHLFLNAFTLAAFNWWKNITQLKKPTMTLSCLCSVITVSEVGGAAPDSHSSRLWSSQVVPAAVRIHFFTFSDFALFLSSVVVSTCWHTHTHTKSLTLGRNCCCQASSGQPGQSAALKMIYSNNLICCWWTTVNKNKKNR